MRGLLIFDWDGTLSDSLARIAFCMQCAAKDHGLVPPSDLQVHEIVGLGLTEALQSLFPDVGDAQLIAALKESYSAHFMANDQVPSPFYPFVMESLVELRERGFLLAVATGKSRRGLDRVLKEKGLESFFDASRCADETRSKPDPLMLVELLGEFSLTPDQAIMVGDTEFDMGMAQRASMPGLAVSYGAHRAERLHRYSPIACVDCFSQVVGAIDRHWPVAQALPSS